MADRGLLEMAFKVGLAVGGGYPGVVVGRDTRTTSQALYYSVAAGLLMAGAECHDAGVIPTPTLAWAAREFDAGVMITASHNPPEYNGIKLLGPDGAAFDRRQQQAVEAMVAREAAPLAPWYEVKSTCLYPGAVEGHLGRILRDFPPAAGLKVVVDAGGGAASLVTPRLLEKMGCRVFRINCSPTGDFPRPSEPTEASLAELARATRQSGAALGIAHDGDADRMMVVDERGRLVPGDKMLVILAREMGARQVVTSLDASMVIEEMGFTVSRTRVGDSFISARLREGGDFGGEPSGAWIFPAVSLCPDGIYAAAQAVAIALKQPLSDLADGIADYPLRRGSLELPAVVLSDLEASLAGLHPESVSRVDGLRLGFADGWLLVRASGTEPKVRLTAQARTEARARQLYDGVVQMIEGGAARKEKVV
ncbi:MAG: phosphoglucosamine mutase [Chloroflexota bacterium]